MDGEMREARNVDSTPKFHIAEVGTLEPDVDGWYYARCECGATAGPFPGPEEVLDELVDHARAAGFAEAQNGSSAREGGL